ncbi:hypothetical protein RHMOL_Rhmol01G0163000 [Rhododendron molle]|uniref:Uncharacterized protein n=1 Tax=Rhododendron molle TaxID=49168 RepID=A0ACC0Q4R4_RHOML|nr:hypothetical protein RHMOL_Rhmol01G0163000 [Rhododendron molle]
MGLEPKMSVARGTHSLARWSVFWAWILKRPRPDPLLCHTLIPTSTVLKPLKGSSKSFKTLVTQKLFQNPPPICDSLPKTENPTFIQAPMANRGDGGDKGEVIDQTEDRGGPMTIQTEDLTTVGEGMSIGAEGIRDGDGVQGRSEKVGDDEDRRASKTEPRATDQASVVGSRVDRVGFVLTVEGSSVIGVSSDVAGSSGVGGDDTEPVESPPRDSVKGKSAVIEEVQVEDVHIEEVQTIEAAPVEIRAEDVAFRPPAGAATSSRHVQITYDDIAEHAPDELVARLLAERPDIGEAEAAARAERERAGEGLAVDVEAEEREAEEALGPRVSAVAEAGAMERPEFSEETYMPPRPHLFVPSGFAGYRPPQQTDYDPELVLRDPGVHIANTWAEVCPFAFT